MKKRRILSILLALAMVLTFMPTMAFAGSSPDEQESSVASITKEGKTTYYDSLKEAIAAAVTSDAVVLIKDAAQSKWISPSDTQNKTITLDLNGHSYARSNNGAAIQLGKNATLLVTDSVGGGSLISTTNISIELKEKTSVVIVNGGTLQGKTNGIRADSGTVTVNGGRIIGNDQGIHTQNGTLTITGGVIEGKKQGILDYENSKPATINITGGSIKCIWDGEKTGADYRATGGIILNDATVLNISESANPVSIEGGYLGIGVFDAATVTVEGGIITGDVFGISGNGTSGYGDYKLNLKGGSISGGTIGMYLPNSGFTTIEGGTITGATGVYQKCGTLTITGGTINGTGEHEDFVHDGNGAHATGDAVVVENCDYPGGTPVLNVEGGSFFSKNAEGIGSYAYGDGREPVEKAVAGGFYSEKPDASIIKAPYTAVRNFGDNMDTYPWKIGIPATVKFDANGGSGNMDEVVVEKGSRYPLPENKFTKPADKCGFDKWDKGAVGTEITVSDDVTLKAQWKDHKWDAGKVTKQPTRLATGTKTYTCTVCKATKTETIPKLRSTAKQVLMAKAVVAGPKIVRITMNKMTGIDRYLIYVSPCSKGYGKPAALSAKKTSYTRSGLRKQTFYKVKVVAQKKVNGKYRNVATAYQMHFVSGNTRNNYWTNPKSISVSRKTISLRPRKTANIKANIVKVKKRNKLMTTSHGPVYRYLSSDTGVATVDKTGKVTARAVGDCTIYVQALNGIWTSVKISVR